MKKVCVLLSTYNGEKYLRPLLDSVLNQKDVDVLIFARDDGSKDFSRDILKEYAKTGKLILAETENVNWGFAKSFSWLIKNAPDADFYAYCDQDDIWLENKLKNAVDRLSQEDENLPLLYHTNLIVVDKDLKEITQDTHLHMTKNSPYQFQESVLQNMTYGCTIVFNNQLRRLYEKIPEEEIRFHDYTLTVIANGLGKVIFEENPQILYRQHGNNTVGFYKGSWKNLIRTAKFVFTNDLKNNKIHEAEICYKYFAGRLSEDKLDFIKLLMGYRKDRKEKKELIKFIKKNIKNKFVKSYSLFLIRLNRF